MFDSIKGFRYQTILFFEKRFPKKKGLTKRVYCDRL